MGGSPPRQGGEAVRFRPLGLAGEVATASQFHGIPPQMFKTRVNPIIYLLLLS